MLDSNNDSRRLRRRWGEGDNTEILFTRLKLRVKFIFTLLLAAASSLFVFIQFIHRHWDDEMMLSRTAHEKWS